MLPSLMAHPEVEIVGAADTRPEALDAFERGFKGAVYLDAEDLMRDPGVEAVYIATPHQFHRDHVLMACQHGKHAIVEKPMALTIEDCDAMNAAVEGSGIRLVVGHTHSFDPPVLEMRRIIREGRLGPVRMINTWNYTDFLYRPRRPEELDTRLGGGIIFNQVPHQVDTVRLLGGGLCRSVRSMTGVWDGARATEGAHSTFLDFEDGAAATIVYSGYDHFDGAEFHEWVGEGGRRSTPSHAGARRALAAITGAEADAKAATGYGGPKRRSWAAVDEERWHPHFGTIVVSCDGGDLRTSPRGVILYDNDGKREVPVPLGRATPDKGRVVDELVEAVNGGGPNVHDGRWGEATLEVCLAILQSGRERGEIALSHQVPVRDSEKG
ncbi:MAG: Gfo/Idh/MocA family oxidoreductase [Chloroflexi bacterium]|nr:Gfo/Idh/MocA family oxidoreductase [Chloroflexota bacterium]